MYSVYIITFFYITIFIILQSLKTTTGFAAGTELHGTEKLKQNFLISTFLMMIIAVPILIVEAILRIAYNVVS